MELLDVSGARGKFAAVPSSVGGWSILDAGQRVIAGMLSTTGTGEPEHGQAFARSALQFRGAEQTMTSARPDSSWSGAAARAYADANAHQADRAASMAVLDTGVHAVLAREADQVSYRRENLDGQATYLADRGSAAESMGLVPGVGTALRSAIELTAVNAALTASTSELHELTREVDENAAALRDIAAEYSATTPHTPDGQRTPSIAAAATLQPQEAGMTALSSAAGVVGGVVSAIVAPVAGVLSGVAGVAGQSLGVLASVVPSAGNEPEAAAADDSVDDIAAVESVDEPSDEPRTERREGDVASRPGSTESEAPTAGQRDKLGREPSPAATRPPR